MRLILLMPVLGLCAGVLTAYWMVAKAPPVYQSVAVIQVKGSKRSIRPLVDEIALIKSRDLLRKVAADLDLMKRWGEKEEVVIEILNDSLELKVLHGTDLIEIQAQHVSAQKAKQIVEGFISAFTERKKEEEKREVRQNFLSAQAAVRDQEELVSFKKSKVEEFLKPDSPFFQQLQNNPNAIEQYHHAKSDLEINERLLDTMREDLARLNAVTSAPMDAVSVHQAAVEPQQPIAAHKTWRMLVGALLGTLVGFVLGLLFAWMPGRKGSS